MIVPPSDSPHQALKKSESKFVNHHEEIQNRRFYYMQLSIGPSPSSHELQSHELVPLPPHTHHNQESKMYDYSSREVLLNPQKKAEPTYSNRHCLSHLQLVSSNRISTLNQRSPLMGQLTPGLKSSTHLLPSTPSILLIAPPPRICSRWSAPCVRPATSFDTTGSSCCGPLTKPDPQARNSLITRRSCSHRHLRGTRCSPLSKRVQRLPLRTSTTCYTRRCSLQWLLFVE